MRSVWEGPNQILFNVWNKVPDFSQIEWPNKEKIDNTQIDNDYDKEND